MLTIEKLSKMEPCDVEPDAFNRFIEFEFVRNDKAITYIEVISDIVEKTGIGYTKTSHLINETIKEKIKKECVTLNLLKNSVKSFDLFDV